VATSSPGQTAAEFIRLTHDNHAAATAGSTLRYGWNDVTRKQCDSAAQVYAALTRRGYTGPFKPCSPTCGAMTRPERRAG
jgi:hypothetical protein